MSAKNLILASIVAIANFGGMANANTQVEVGCSVIEFIDDAMVQFSGVLARKDIADVISSAPEKDNISAQTAKMLGIDGTLSVLVSIEGNGNAYSANYPLNYKVVGNRIEPVLGQNMHKLSSYEDFRDSFGAFPNVRCVASN
jgi:hypothetical protein